jgi:hypothetical protein
MTGQPYDDDPDAPNRYNTHAAPPEQAEGVPEEEDLSRAQAHEQLQTEPDEAENATDPEGGPQKPKMS